ncbi:D-beta-hydroxybutyrate dehydrogenase, mitochondrial-like [Acanthaster planci]|uniref:D-beta-hydroxybutyrate dehydrogenase, mitochondrial-like n=1 Tax=Acanthaster planci TaxID=133434 RepID=A0A8B7YCI2_ACAPL|nr:D-beta-hydroxybutyrate dehydrogenase, mitochondrial-like [Acanthaster planci]
MAAVTIKNLAVFLLSAFVFAKYVVPRIGQELLSRCFGYIVSIILAYVIAVNVKEGKLQVAGKAVVVTGCDTGIGNALARYLDKQGFRVFAGCLFETGEGARKLKEECSRKLQVVQMDVTSDEQVVGVARFVQSAVSVSGDVLWGVVNNAGILILGEIEWLSLDSYRQVMEVNLMGMIRVTKAFLPMIRKCKGRIVNMSSAQGLFAAPSGSPYAISKFGVEAFSDCLRLEMDKWGVKAVIIEPGNYSAFSKAFDGDSIDRMLDTVWTNTPDHVKQVYGEDYFNTVLTVLKSTTTTSAPDLKPVLSAVEDALIDVNPPDRLSPSNTLSKLLTWFFRYLPVTVTDNLYKLAYAMLVDKATGV